ncbi:winged helix DNA-binding domain-containing protein, partial [Dentipellis sp. KUC8613]
PLSEIAVPLDHTRFYLLGQLEYYLSSQNLAQDFFLRKQMDSRGWIPIALLASFRRVRQLTPDAALVHEVLLLSTIVEVIGEHVRMGSGEWRQFVLPDAPASTVEVSELAGTEAEAEAAEGECEEGEEEDEDDEVEFVISKEVGQPWVSAS